MRIIDVKFKDIKEGFDKFTKSENNSESPNPKRKKLAGKFIIALVLIIFLLLAFSTSFYSVDQTEYVILTTYGVPSMDIKQPGLRMKFPFGIQNIIRIPKRTFSTTLGYHQEGDNITVQEKESKMITGDENIILADMEVQWRVVDPIAYYYNNDNPDNMLYNAISSSLRNVIGSSTVDDALTDGRSEIIEKVKTKLSALVDEYKLGISIINVNLQDIDLPTSDVDKAFKSVTDAREERVTKINEANKYRNEKMNELAGKESAILSKANAQKTVAIQKAKGDVAKFNALYEEYTKAPEITKKDLIINTLNRIYSNAKLMITDGETFKYLSIEEMMKGVAK